MAGQEASPLRRGWTTGACAAAAARAAYAALLTGRFPDPVAIRLPRGQKPSFPLAAAEVTGAIARAGVIKDAGDDPDVTHGATITAEVAWAPPGSGIRFAAGEGVGTATRPGLQLAAGHLDLHSSKSQVEPETLIEILASVSVDKARMSVARVSDSAGALLESAGPRAPALAGNVARRAHEVALATLSGATAVDVAIVDRSGEFLARVGDEVNP
jgi:cobalt-precorrin-5B (C1)-methyltransferase